MEVILDDQPVDDSLSRTLQRLSSYRLLHSALMFVEDHLVQTWTDPKVGSLRSEALDLLYRLRVQNAKIARARGSELQGPEFS